jgi:hypothetical protein
MTVQGEVELATWGDAQAATDFHGDNDLASIVLPRQFQYLRKNLLAFRRRTYSSGARVSGILCKRVSPLNPKSKRSCSWGSVELWSEGGAVGNGIVVIHGKTARFARRRTVHKSMDRPLAVLLCHSFWSLAGSLPMGSRTFVRSSIALPGVSGPTLEATDFQLFQSIRQILVRHLP